MLLRPYLLELRDFLTEENGGSFVDIIGSPGTGRSCAIMYAACVAREKNWYVKSLPSFFSSLCFLFFVPRKTLKVGKTQKNFIENPEEF